MSESRVGYHTNSTLNQLDQNGKRCDTITVNRADLEKEHSLLIARLHLLRQQLGYPPLTDKEARRQANK
jgi:hypothetical protein